MRGIVCFRSVGFYISLVFFFGVSSQMGERVIE